MRLTEKEIQAIKQTGHEIYGDKTEIWLFGSRVNDHNLGGDIDLLIVHPQTEKLTIDNKIDFLVALKNKIGDQHIDIVYDKGQKTIVKTAKEQGLRL